MRLAIPVLERQHLEHGVMRTCILLSSSTSGVPIVHRIISSNIYKCQIRSPDRGEPHSECVIGTLGCPGIRNLRLIWKFCLCSPGRQIVNNVRRPLSVYTLVQRELQGDDLRVRSQTSPFRNFGRPATLLVATPRCVPSTR